MMQIGSRRMRCSSWSQKGRFQRFLRYSSNTSSTYASTSQGSHNEGEKDPEDIVISGISGRFPQSDNMEELKHNLFNRVDMVTENTRFKSHKMVKNFGFIKNPGKFDASFFGIMPKMVNSMDPQHRKLLEVTFEAILDSGTNPDSLRGSQTGVFVGMDAAEARDYWLMKSYTTSMEGYGLALGPYAAANRTSFFFDLKGPSLSMSTACSGSLTTLEVACQSMKGGSSEAAIVAGSLLLLSPLSPTEFLELGALSPDGKSRTFDESGNGYARSETVAAVLIQKRKHAKRVYATIRGVQSNADGYKSVGFTYPSGLRQQDLIRRIYEKTGIPLKDVKYLEAHGTGTPVGDPEELNAIWNSFCKPEVQRTEPLLIGSVKSNLGHSECAAGLTGIAKCIISIQERKIPPNLCFNKPRKNTAHLFDGSLNVITEDHPWNGGIMGINSFGIGGTNAHLILESEKTDPTTNATESQEKKAPQAEKGPKLPLILPFSGRTEETVKTSLNKAIEHSTNPEFSGLIHNVFKQNIRGHFVRGFGLVTPGSEPVGEKGSPENQVTVETLKIEGGQRLICFVFPGMGSQWTEMGKVMTKIDCFHESLKRSRDTLKNCGVDLDLLLKPNNDAIFKNIRDAVPSITAVQIALFDTMTSLGVTPDLFFGHSFGEILCGYADGSFTAEEALLVSDARGRAFSEAIKAHPMKGEMAAVGLSWKEVAAKCPANVYPACNNSENNVTVAGEASAVSEFVKTLSSEGIFARQVNSCGCAAHSPLIYSATPNFVRYVQEFYPKEREQPRSARWISTSIPETEWNSPLARTNSAAYHENNVKHPVLFGEAFKHVPKDAVVVEIAPTGVFQGILKRSLDQQNFVISPMTSKGKNVEKINFFFNSLGKMYNAGVNLDLGALYPPISFPVSPQTPGLSSLASWNHEQNFLLPVVSNLTKMASEGVSFKIDLTNSEDHFLEGHKLDTRIVYPATGYLVSAWKVIAQNMGVDCNSVPMCFENVTFERATVLNDEFHTELQFLIQSNSGHFEIVEDGATVVRGDIKLLEEDAAERILKNWKNQNPNFSSKTPGSAEITMNTEDVYKELKLRE